MAPQSRRICRYIVTLRGDSRGPGSLSITDMTPFSILDLAPIVEGGTPPRRSGTASTWRSMPSGGAITASGWPSTTTCRRSPARRRRSSSPTSRRARRRSGSAPAGSCCRTTAPLVIAEQFGTLESLFPGRIDLGLGRAPGERPGDGAGARRATSTSIRFRRTCRS